VTFTRVVNFDDRDSRAEFINRVHAWRGRLEITAEEWSERRSGGANRYYWSVVVKHYGEFVKSHTGEQHHPLVLHEDLKRRFLPMRESIDVLTGEVKGWEVAYSHTMKSEAFWDYIGAVRAWMSQMNWDIPDPGEYGIREPKKGAA
jgi:hypothetical protein